MKIEKKLPALTKKQLTQASPLPVILLFPDIRIMQTDIGSLEHRILSLFLLVDVIVHGFHCNASQAEQSDDVYKGHAAIRISAIFQASFRFELAPINTMTTAKSLKTVMKTLFSLINFTLNSA